MNVGVSDLWPHPLAMFLADDKVDKGCQKAHTDNRGRKLIMYFDCSRLNNE